MELIQIIFTATFFYAFTTSSERDGTNNPWRKGANLQFLSTRWTRWKIINNGDAYTIKCRTNDPAANVYLVKRLRSSQPWVNTVNAFNGRMQQIRQDFSIDPVIPRDAGQYMCKAENDAGEKAELNKGRVVVKRSMLPDIYPNKDILRVKRNSFQNITCSTQPLEGITSVLTWYKVKGKSISKLAKNMIQNEELVLKDGKVRYKSILMLKKVLENDVGRYLCERKMRLTSTHKIITVTLLQTEEMTLTTEPTLQSTVPTTIQTNISDAITTTISTTLPADTGENPHRQAAIQEEKMKAESIKKAVDQIKWAHKQLQYTVDEDITNTKTRLENMQLLKMSYETIDNIRRMLRARQRDGYVRLQE